MDSQEEPAEFTFPSITNTPPRFFESPPLWRPSSSSKDRGDRQYGYVGVKGDDEERMDVLWEDLNEENLKNLGLVSKSGISGGANVKFGCLQAFNPSSNGGKRPSVLVFIKVLRKWLLLRNAHRSIKKRPR